MSGLSDKVLGLRLKEADFPSLLLYSIVGFASAALLWAAVARVDVVVGGSGRLVPASQLQTLSNLEGGTLARIAVRPGQVVRAGQVLLLLDPVLRASDAAAGQASVDALSARAARLSAEARGSGARIDLPQVDPQLLASERALAQSDATALAAERGLALARQDQARRGVTEAEAQLQQRQEALRLAAREEIVMRPLVEQGAEPRLSLDRLVSQRLQAEAAARAGEAAFNRARAGLAEADRAVLAVDTRFRNRAAEALATTRAELASRNGQQPALADRLARTQVRAPVAGIVSRLLVSTPGAAVSPGEPLVEMVPVGDRLLVEAKVTPADIGFVKAGQQAKVRVTAYDYSIYGALTGEVQNVAPDAVVDQRTGEVHFLVRIALPGNCFATEDAGCLPLGPGMLADVSVLGPKRSILSYLLSPLTRITSSAFTEK
jgi:membrane fusion protein, adhesin transport system